ncbi:MAG: hypothetical protein CVV05_13360 [Gammaproteobacteria bacterium HGW-Gammaproteobacteria-1]|jgi:diguanylate cyclase (GGDEF)-like protein/PAS domain S-box-containing protein|nr:MAG: hypothetical protein CVV05_13360 [Gammaproteobacteria bacterium HGW-Gammaproteobacteria-1]
MFSSNAESPPLREYFKVFALAFLPIFLVVSLAVAYLDYRDHQLGLDKIRSAELSQIVPPAQLLNRDIDSVLSDLMILAHADELARYVAQPDRQARQRVERLFALFSREKRIYDQIRYLDDTGMERVRINFHGGTATVTPPEELQDKSARYYFTEVRRLNAGTVFVSPLDLNVEHGALEVPHKPMLRFATPVFGAHGERHGVVVLNYLAGNMLERARSQLAGGAGMLLDGDGYWLFGPEPGKEWGRDLNHGATFAAEHPRAWAAMQAEPAGQLLIDDALFTYRMIIPLAESGTGDLKGRNDMVFHALNGGARAYHWYLISYLSPQHLTELLAVQSHDYLSIYLFSLLLFMMLAASYAYVRVHQRLAERNIRLAAMVMDVTRDGVVIADQEKRIISINHAYSALTGRTHMDVIGKDLRAVHGELYDDEHCTEIWRGVEENEIWQGEAWLRHKDGEFVPLVTMLGMAVDGQRRCRNFVEIMSDISALKSKEQNLQRLAYHDALTGLPNRYLFEDRLAMAVAAATRDNGRVAVVYVDLNDFKPINDQYGHDTGDRVLREAGRRLRQACLRSTDTVARLGGDEFAIILQDIDSPRMVEELIHRLHLALREPLALATVELTISASIGYGLYPEAGTDAETVLQAADRAMYREKMRARENRVH